MDSRFMIDIATYKQMHRNQDNEPEQHSSDREELPIKLLSEDNPMLGDTFFLCLPTSIAGFNMQTKEWSAYHFGSLSLTTHFYMASTDNWQSI